MSKLSNLYRHPGQPDQKGKLRWFRIILTAALFIAVIIPAIVFFPSNFDFSTSEPTYAIAGHNHKASEISDFNTGDYVRKSELDSLFTKWQQDQVKLAEAKEVQEIQNIIPEGVNISAKNAIEITSKRFETPRELYKALKTLNYTRNDVVKMIRSASFSDYIALAKDVAGMVKDGTATETAAMLVAYYNNLKPYVPFSKTDSSLVDTNGDGLFRYVTSFENKQLSDRVVVTSEGEGPQSLNFLRYFTELEKVVTAAKMFCSNADVEKWNTSMKELVVKDLGDLSLYTGKTEKTAGQNTEITGKKADKTQQPTTARRFKRN